LNPTAPTRHHVSHPRTNQPTRVLKPRGNDNFHARLQQAWQQHQAGNLAEAERAYDQLLAIEPNHPDVNNLLGLLCIQAGRFGEAEACIRTALRSDPDNAQAHYNLGIASAKQQRFTEAATHFGRAVELQPGNPEALSSQGNALRLAGQPEAAVGLLRAALSIEPRHHRVRHNLGLALNDAGAALNREGDADAAIVRFREALQFAPGHPQAQMNLGLTLEQTGHLEQAARCYQAAIKAKPDFADAHFHLAHLRTHRSGSEEIAAMRALLEQPFTAAEDRVRLSFGLGFALESVADYPAAFGYMNEGHRLQGLGSEYSLEREAQRFSAIKEAFSAGRVAALQGSGRADDRPVLIAGMPRSGTTLAEQVLASHPAVQGRGESMALARAAVRLGWPFDRDLSRLDSATLRDEARVFLAQLTGEAGTALKVVDTTPMNFRYFGLAALMLPGARFIHCLRDPMDNGLSIYRQYLTGPRGFEHDLRTLGRYYRLHLDLLDHWREALSGRLYVLHYEQLVEHPEAETRRLLKFLDLPFDARCLAFHETDRVVRSPSAGQVRQPLYANSIGAWRRYETFLQPLAEALAERPAPGRNVNS
jgi:Flp pilus assembly protein TadD